MRALVWSLSLVCGLLGGLAETVAQAPEAYPARPVKFIAPFPPGGSVDLVSRVITHPLSQSMGQQFVVDNRTGAGGNIGADLIAKAPPDGYTIGLVTIASHGINPSLYAKLPYDPIADFTAITLLCTLPNIMVITPKLAEIKTVQQFIDYAKARPGQLNFGSPGNGTSIHLSGELFKIRTGTDMIHIPYRGSALAQPELTSGGIHVMFDNLPSIIGPVEGGSFPALAVTSKTRWRGLPNVPTLEESGVKDFDVSSWFAIVGPANMPRPVVDKLNAAILAALKTEETKQALYKLGADPVGSTPEALVAHMKAEIARWAVVVKASGAKID